MRPIRRAIPATVISVTLLTGFALLPPARGGEPAQAARVGQSAKPPDPRDLQALREAHEGRNADGCPTDSSGAQGLADWAAVATGADANAARAATARLRAAGPPGLGALLEANADAVSRHAGGSAVGAEAGEDWTRMAAAIDAVAAQKDAYASGLYWYTDWEAAEKAARESGKPILSLRLLGTLDSEYSCANSRFFRTVLYANKEVSRALADRFVLHWKSVRPVPRITIDFGDGRVVERTITGNSIHYVLDADGNVIDAVPGLYGAKAFLRQVFEAEALAKQVRPMDPAAREATLREWHASRAKKDLEQWRADLHEVGVAVEDVAMIQPLQVQAAPPVANPPPALAAAPRAMGKAAVERPVVAALAPGRGNALAVNLPAAPAAAPPAAAAAPRAVSKFGVEGAWVLAIAPAGANWAKSAGVAPTAPGAGADAAVLALFTDDATWLKLAALHASDAKMDDGSRALMAAKNPDALRAGRVARSKTLVENPLARLVRNFEWSVAEDTVRNEYTFHRQIHQWLADGKTGDGKAVAGVDPLNEQVYAQLFLTPSSDPWLGLVPADTYTALPDEGVCQKR